MKCFSDISDPHDSGTGRHGELGQESILPRGRSPGTMPPPPSNIGSGKPWKVVAGLYALTAAPFSATFIRQTDIHGRYHTCVLVNETGGGQSVRCFGANSDGQLGIGSRTYVGDLPGTMPPNPVPIFTFSLSVVRDFVLVPYLPMSRLIVLRVHH
jgi:hypothetical protein